MGRYFFNEDDYRIERREDGSYYCEETGQDVDERGEVIAEPERRWVRMRYSIDPGKMEEYFARDEDVIESDSIYNTEHGYKFQIRQEIREFFGYCERMAKEGDIAKISSEEIGQFLSLHMMSQMSPMRDELDRYDTLLGDTDMNDRYKKVMKAFFEDPEKRKAVFNRFLDYEMDALKEMSTNAEKNKESPVESMGGFAVLLVENMIQSCGEEIQAEYHEALKGRLDQPETEQEKRRMKDALSLFTKNVYPSQWPKYEYHDTVNGFRDLVWEGVEKAVGDIDKRFINLDMLYFRRNDLNDMLRDTLFDKKFHDFFCEQEEKLVKEENQMWDNLYSQFDKDVGVFRNSLDDEIERYDKIIALNAINRDFLSFLNEEWDLTERQREEWSERCKANFKEQHDLAMKIKEARREKDLGSLMENQLKKDYNLLSPEELKTHEENVQKLLGVDAPEASENLMYLFEKQAELKAELGRMYRNEKHLAQEETEWKLLNSGTQIRIHSLEHLARSSGQDSGLLDAMEETGELHYRERKAEHADGSKNLDNYRELRQKAENGLVPPLSDEKARYAEQVKGVQEAVGKDLIPDDSQKSYELKEQFSRATVKNLISKLDQTQKSGENSQKYTDMMNSLREFSEKGTNLETAISQCQNYISARERMWGPVSQIGKDRLALAKDIMKTFDILREEKANIREVPEKAPEQKKKAVSSAGRVTKIGFQELQKEEGHTQERRSSFQRESINKEHGKQMNGLVK